MTASDRPAGYGDPHYQPPDDCPPAPRADYLCVKHEMLYADASPGGECPWCEYERRLRLDALRRDAAA